MTRIPLALVVIALALAAPAFGQTPSSSPPAAAAAPARPAVADADRSFARQAARAGLAEIEAGRLAMDRARSEQVKTFARAMVNDHSEANAKLAGIAKRKGIALPRSSDKARHSESRALAALEGAAFEHAYLDGRLADHRKSVALFERQARNGRDPELKRFAAESLPRLKGHLAMAENLAQPAKTGAVAPPAGGHAAHPRIAALEGGESAVP